MLKMFNGNSRVELLKIFVVLCLTKCVFSATVSHFLDSPCPNIFEYRYDENGLLYGSIQIECPDDNKIQLNIELSVGNNVEGYNGNIQLLHSKEKVIDDVMHRRPITYKVYFPLWSNIPPKITKILVNGDLICHGEKISNRLVPVHTTINLQHTLEVNVQPLSLNDNSKGTNNFDPPTKDDTPNPRRSGNNKGGSNQFNINFNPPPKSGTNPVTNFNFNPQVPKDPSKIYPGNPFLKGLTSPSTPIKRNNEDSAPSQTTPAIEVRTTVKPFLTERTDIFPGPTKGGGGSTTNPYSNVCGRTVVTNSLVINGNTVPRGAYPWLVAMFGVKATGLNYMCSGSLISNRHVVTAAHCVKTETKKYKPQELLIILGKLNLRKWMPMDGEKMIEPEEIIVHPDYESNSSDADIAVLVLSESVEFTKYIRPLCLWNTDTDLNRVVGKEGTVVGWGKDENDNLMTAEPKQTSLPIASQEQCLRSSYQFQYITSNRTFCAGFRNGSGPCNGDSGSGFLMKMGDRWLLKGIVSMSISAANTRTCDLNNYVVFTDASKHLDWLLSFIK